MVSAEFKDLANNLSDKLKNDDFPLDVFRSFFGLDGDFHSWRLNIVMLSKMLL